MKFSNSSDFVELLIFPNPSIILLLFILPKVWIICGVSGLDWIISEGWFKLLFGWDVYSVSIIQLLLYSFSQSTFYL